MRLLANREVKVYLYLKRNYTVAYLFSFLYHDCILPFTLSGLFKGFASTSFVVFNLIIKILLIFKMENRYRENIIRSLSLGIIFKTSTLCRVAHIASPEYLCLIHSAPCFAYFAGT